MKIFVCSDSHFNHANILKYCNRPFSSVEEMNNAIIRNWNNAIAEDDIVIFCGDLCFARTAQAAEVTQRLTEALHGQKIIITGNHDFKKLDYTQLGWKLAFHQEWVFNNRLCFRHRPGNQDPFTFEYKGLERDSSKYDYIFYGHTHQFHVPAPINFINVCLDANNLQPIDITNYFTEEEIKELKALILGKD